MSSEIVVRLADHSDCKPIVELFHSEEHETHNQGYYMTHQSIQTLLTNNSYRIFVAEQDSQLSAVVIACVVDAGTTLVVKSIHIRDSYRDSDIATALLTCMYKVMAATFSRLRMERFVSSCESFLTKLLDKNINPNLRSNQTGPGKFTNVFQLDQQVIEIEGGASFGKRLDSLVRDSCLVHLTKKEADLYILRNLSCFCGHTLIVNSVPYKAQLSNANTIFTESEYLLGESNRKDLNGNGALRVPTPDGTASGRNSPTRLQSSHLVNVLDSLHTNLRSMSGSLRGLHNSLQDAMPKSFSHGKQLSKPHLHKVWTATIYSEDVNAFRAHVLEQLRAATLHLKASFTFTLNYNSAMATEARRLCTEELGMDLSHHERKTIVVYERPIDAVSFPNGMLRLK